MSTSSQSTRDPRTIITPDAFSVAPSLVGLPLASPSRRFVAIAIDLIFVAAFSFLGWYLLGLAVVLGAFRAATRKGGSSEGGISEGQPKQVFTAFRVILGCFGTLVLLVVLAMGSLFLLNQGDLPTGVASNLEDLVSGDDDAEVSGLMGLVRGIGSFAELQNAETPEEASAAVASMAVEMERAGVGRSEIRAALGDMAPDGSGDWWPDALEVGLAQALDGGEASLGAEDPDASGDAAARSLDQALVAYAELVRNDEVPDSPEARVLREEILSAVGSDSLAALNSALGDIQSDLDTSQRNLQSTQNDLEVAENSGLFAIIRDFAESTGLLFGWGTVYMSLFTAWWNGQTIGKKLLGIRVVRLDGKPMNGWFAFERAGGYAAGFATGLIGFAQIYWDPNRMAIHDKVTETAVIREGAPRVPGPWNRTETPKDPDLNG